LPGHTKGVTQVGKQKSHTFDKVSLMESGGGQNGQKKKEERKWKMDMEKPRLKNEIDFIITNKRYIITDVSALNRFNTGSDHRLTRAKIKINLGTERKKLIHQKRFPTILELQQNVDTYQRNIKSKLPSITQMTKVNLDELDQKIRNSMQTATKQICSGEKPKCSKSTS